MTGERDPESMTSDDTYFEDFTAGDVYEHARGKTLSEDEMHGVAHMTMNTAEAHFNADEMRDSEHGERINYGGTTMSIVLGLASSDTTENVVQTTGLDGIRFHAPVQAGDTLYAVTKVLETDADATDNPDTGFVRFEHYGLNEDEDHIFTGVQECVVKCRPGDER
ncbi:MaoC family dehydratase [Natronomonas gomsonensis]|uniref:MaoC family dehydratase n=1 Tax=Natronomonas gomsonensis TaxID=1046043 RepID=UPI0020CA9B73|nr:MaoC family dehydratase [Natronomonas gomsonensis]MCY4729915.1 MaoC family dehydratase [Natronomonas gomsonensis]